MSTIKPVITNRLLKHVAQSEGLRYKAYKDAGGVWTIGYGHTYNVHEGDTVSQEQALAFLSTDLHYAVGAVMRQFPAMPQHRIDALSDFVFNLGERAFLNSTLIKIIRTDPENIASINYQLNRWCHCNGKVLPGLVARRRWESDCYQGLIKD